MLLEEQIFRRFFIFEFASFERLVTFVESFVSQWRYCKSISEDIMECSPDRVARIIVKVSLRKGERKK